MSSHTAPEAAPPVVDRATFDAALADQVVKDKELTRHGDRVSADRRRLPMVEVEDHTFAGPDGPIRLTELFGAHHLLLVQNVMFDPDWDDGCPSCSYAVDSISNQMQALDDGGIAFAMISQGPIDKLQAWREKRGWDHLWVSSHDTSYHDDWGWTQYDEQGGRILHPGYSYYLLRDGVPYLTYTTRNRGTEAILPIVHIQDRTVYGRQQDWEDSPAGWPQKPTYG